MVLIAELSDNYIDLVRKVRKVVKLFKGSPMRNTKVQSDVILEFGYEIGLLLDCKTWRNSLVNNADHSEQAVETEKCYSDGAY